MSHLQLYFLVPGSLNTKTGGSIYDRRIVEGLRARGDIVHVRELDAAFPYPSRAALSEAADQLAAIPGDGIVVIDGLALGAMPAEAEREARRLRIVALLHHPLAAESGLAPEVANAFVSSERRALAAARAVVVTSRATAGGLQPYGVPGDRIHVVEPGTDPAPLASGSGGGDVRLLSVATLIPRKGHEILFRALAVVPHPHWQLACVGSLERDPETVARLRTVLRELALESRVRLAGEMDGAALASQYDAADVFVLPTLYEGYGMAVAEALARGLPVISTATGAIGDLLTPPGPAKAGLYVPSSHGPAPAGHYVPPPSGIVVNADDVGELAAALATVIGDRDARRRLAEGARIARSRLSSWDRAAQQMAEVIDRVQR